MIVLDNLRVSRNPVFETTRNSIKEVKAVKLVDFQDKMINNDKDD